MAGFKFLPTPANIAAAVMQRLATVEEGQTALQGMAVGQVRRTQGVRVTTPALTVLVSTQDITVTWPFPYADADYVVLAQVDGAAAALGKISAAVKPGSQTGPSCVVTVTSLGVAVPAGQGVTVVGIHA